MRSSNPSKRESSVSAGSAAKLLHGLRQRPSLWRERDHAPVGRGAVDRVERGRDVHAQHHPRPAAVRLVVDLAGAEGRRVAVVEEPQLELGAEHGGEGPLLGQPAERVRHLGEDVDLHEPDQVTRRPRSRATTTRPASRSSSRTHASTRGRSRPESSTSASFAGPFSTSATTPSARPPCSSTASPTSWKT